MINNIKMTVVIDADSMADALQALHSRVDAAVKKELQEKYERVKASRDTVDKYLNEACDQFPIDEEGHVVEADYLARDIRELQEWAAHQFNDLLDADAVRCNIIQRLREQLDRARVNASNERIELNKIIDEHARQYSALSQIFNEQNAAMKKLEADLAELRPTPLIGTDYKPLPLTHVFKDQRGDVVGRMYGGGLDLVENYELGIKEGIKEGVERQFNAIFDMLDFSGNNTLTLHRGESTNALFGDKLKQALKEGK